MGIRDVAAWLVGPSRQEAGMCVAAVRVGDSAAVRAGDCSKMVPLRRQSHFNIRARS